MLFEQWQFCLLAELNIFLGTRITAMEIMMSELDDCVQQGADLPSCVHSCPGPLAHLSWSRRWTALRLLKCMRGGVFHEGVSCLTYSTGASSRLCSQSPDLQRPSCAGLSGSSLKHEKKISEQSQHSGGNLIMMGGYLEMRREMSYYCS